MISVPLCTHSNHSTDRLLLSAIDQNFGVHCRSDAGTREAIALAFAGMHTDISDGPGISILEVTEKQEGFLLGQEGDENIADDLGDLLYLLDKSIVLSLQGARRDLCFIHAGAVLGSDGRVVVLTAASGSGKSTLTWALLHHGYRYLSDELAPIDPVTLDVHAYPHALCLKRRPPAPYPLPDRTLVTSRSLHVPVAPGATSGRLAAIFFVDHRRPSTELVSAALSPARAAMHLYANALNPLAHPNEGLDVITAITRRVPAFEVNTADLGNACLAIDKTLASLPR